MDLVKTVTVTEKCLTEEARFLCLSNLQDKMLATGMYDIGGTFDQKNNLEFWFRCLTSRFNDIYMVKIFMKNLTQEETISVGIGTDDLEEQTKLKNTSKSYKLEQYLEFYTFKNLPYNSFTFLKSFASNEVAFKKLGRRDVFVAFQILPENETPLSKEIQQSAKVEDNIGKLLFNNDFSDVILETCDGCKLPAHKLLLISQSKAFKSLLSSDTTVIKLADIDKPTLECVLSYIYIGRVDKIMESDCIELLKAAITYSIDGLITLARFALCKKINADNVFDVLYLAEKYHLNDLMKPVCALILKDANVTLKSEKWKNFDNIASMKLLTEYLCKQDNK